MKKRILGKKIAVTLAAGIFICGSQVFAAEDTVFQFDQMVVTAERVSQKVSNIPANVTLITAKELQNKGARTLADALTGISGINVQSYGGAGQKAIPYILGTDRVVVIIDGKRMNLPQGIGVGSGGIDLNTIMLGDNIERIEVVRGGASTLYGADAVGGVINIITKKGEGSAKTAVSIAGGNYGAKQYDVTFGGQEKNTHWQLSGNQDENDGQRKNSTYKGKNVVLRVDQDLSKAESLTFTYDYYGSHAGLPGSLSWPSTSDYQDILRHSYSVDYTKEAEAGSRILRYYNNDQVYSGETGGPFHHKNTVRAFEYQDSAKLDKANLLTWGTEWRKDEVVSTAEGNVPFSGTTKAVYLQNQHSFNADAKITVGLRRDDSSIYGTHWLPQAAYLNQINESTSYFANWAKVFKAPKFDDLYGNDGYGNTGNPNLRPETGWTAETGVKTKLNSANEAAFSVFRRNITNAIKWSADADYTYHPHNIGSYKATGVNVSLISKLSPATSTDVGYTYLDSRDQNNNTVGDPRHSFHVALNVHQGKLSQGIYGIFQDQAGSKTSQVASYFTVNTNTNYFVSKDTSIFLKIQNLFARQYQAVNGYPVNGRTILLGVKQTL